MTSGARSTPSGSCRPAEPPRRRGPRHGRPGPGSARSVCTVESDPVHEHFLLPIDAAVVEHVLADWDPETASKGENALRAGVLKAGSGLCSGLLENDSKATKKDDPGSLVAGYEKVRAKFDASVRKAQDRAMKKGVPFRVVDPIGFGASVENVVYGFSALARGPE